MKVKIKSRKLEQKQDDVCENSVNETGEQELDEAWYDAVKAGAQALNPLKGVTQKVGKFVQDARGASLEADAKREVTQLIKLMDSVAPKFQQLVDRATKLYGGDMKHPMVGAILGIKKNITTHRNALQSLTTKPLLQQQGTAQAQNPQQKQSANNPAAAGTSGAATTTPPATVNQTTPPAPSAAQQQVNTATPRQPANAPQQPKQNQQLKQTVIDRSNRVKQDNLGMNRPSIKNMPKLPNPKEEEEYRRLINKKDSGKDLTQKQMERLAQLTQKKLQTQPSKGQPGAAGQKSQKIQLPDFSTSEKVRNLPGK